MKKDEVRYIVTAAVSIPVIRLTGKTVAYRQATKPGWGTVEWYSAADNYTNPVYRDRSDKTQRLGCDEYNSADIYTKDGRYFGIYPYDEINVKEMPKQAEVAAIIHGDSCGYDFWTEDGQIRIFVTYDENGLIDNHRLVYGDTPIYDGEVELTFEDLLEHPHPEKDWTTEYRADIPGTFEYQRKQEVVRAAADRPIEQSQDRTEVQGTIGVSEAGEGDQCNCCEAKAAICRTAAEWNTGGQSSGP